MLYSGVEFDRTGFTVTVLSETFAWLGENRFYNTSPQPSLSAWMAQFKEKSTEPVAWHFDATDWRNPDLPTYLFDFPDAVDRLFLVNHRALCNLVQFLTESRGGLVTNTNFLKKSFLLASVRRLLSSQQIKRFLPMNEFF